MPGLVAAGAALAMLASPSLQGQPGPLNYAFSYNVSAYNDTTSLVEFNIEFSDAGLAYVKQKDGAMMGQLYTRLTFREKGNPEPRIADWVTAVPQGSGDGEARAMLGSKLVALPPGEYDAQIYYQDEADQGKRDSASFKLDVPSFAGGNLQLSDVVVVNEAAPSDDPANPFFRNGYMVLPNVSSVINPPFLVLNTYTEVYNANRIATSEYHLVYRLADASRKVFYETKLTRPRPSSKVSVELNSIPLDSLPSGQYFVSVKAYGGLSRWATDSVMVFRSFVVNNPELDAYRKTLAAAPAAATDATAIVDPEYAGLKEDELDTEYAKVRYIAGDAEDNLWEGLSGADSKARFLTRFWGVRDPSPGTPENENRQEYYKRVEEARNLYSAPMAPRGWDSDRGRVLLKYGKPDGVERHFQEFNRKPYEVWSYNRLNYEFVFIDRTQTGAFSLVHSNAPSEVRNANWEQVATLNNSSTGSSYEGSR